MGSFSFICKNSNNIVKTSRVDGEGDAVYLYLLKNGKVIEEMYGNCGGNFCNTIGSKEYQEFVCVICNSRYTYIIKSTP